MLKRILPFIILVLVFAIILFLPVIPIQQAAVVPRAVYSLGFTSIFSLVVPLRLGIRYTVEWYSLLVILILLGTGFAAIRHFSKHIIHASARRAGEPGNIA